jgi:hypothetical protein
MVKLGKNTVTLIGKRNENSIPYNNDQNILYPLHNEYIKCTSSKVSISDKATDPFNQNACLT